MSDSIKHLENKIDKLQADFQSKLKYDQHKDHIIDHLHNELQEYKNDLIKKLVQPMIMDVIQTIDDFQKLTVHYQQKKDIDPRKLLKLMATIPDDLEHLLYRQGIEVFHCTDPIFNPNRQRVVKTVVTHDIAKDKTIAKILHQGYEWENQILRQEMVEVYLYTKE